MIGVLPTYIYYIFGGSHLTISAATFLEKLKSLTTFLSHYVNGGNMLIEYVKSITHKKKESRDN